MYRRILFMCGFIYWSISSYAAIDIIFDYSYDSGNYFGDEQRYIMEQVAYVFESRITSGFSSTRPEDITGAAGVTAILYFRNPTTRSRVKPVIGSMTADGNEIGKENELIIFLGARSTGFSSSSVLASASATNSYVSSYSSSSARDAWNARKNSKDTSSVFQPVAGSSQVNSTKSFYFDTDLTTHADATSSGKVDFYSVMVHEIGHIMGFTSSEAFKNFSSGGVAGVGSWTGPNAKAEYNGQNIPLNGNPHWGNSIVQGNVNCACHPSMLPSIGSNTRTAFSDLDFALLKDVGYTISASPVGTNIGGTYTDPTWGGTYDIPVSMTYADWLAGGGGGGGGGGGSAAPEPAYIFTLLGGVLAFIGGRKNLSNIKALFRIA